MLILSVYLKSQAHDVGNSDMSLFIPSSFAAVEAGLEAQAAHVKEISATDSAVNNRKIVSNIKARVTFSVFLPSFLLFCFRTKVFFF